MEILLLWLLAWIGPALLGTGAWWLSNKVKGRNGQKALRYAAFGLWTLPLRLILPLLLSFVLGGILGGLGWVLGVVISVGFFAAAGNSLLKEMRAQQRGEYTERAM